MNDDLEGYKLLYGLESHGGDSFCLKIFVKMSAREVDDEDSYDAGEAIGDLERALMTRTAKLDPNGPSTRERYRREIEKIYEDAGVTAIYMEPLPNGYCSLPCCLNKPWFRVTSKIGHVVIGWRKSVISIDWKDTQVKKSGESLSSDNVTRWESGIHAYGVEKATEYIRALHAEGEKKEGQL